MAKVSEALTTVAGIFAKNSAVFLVSVNMPLLTVFILIGKTHLLDLPILIRGEF